MRSLQLYHMDIGDSYGEMVECMRYDSTTVVLVVTKLTTIGNWERVVKMGGYMHVKTKKKILP